MAYQGNKALVKLCTEGTWHQGALGLTCIQLGSLKLRALAYLNYKLVGLGELLENIAVVYILVENIKNY